MKRHLFLFTLGPVQSFIAQARKTQDLFGGSRLLSDLCRVAAQHFESIGIGGTVIFPKTDSTSIPNRFLGSITTGEGNLKSIGEKVQQAVEDEWTKKIAQPILKDFGLDAEHNTTILDQLSNHLYIQWAFQTITEDTDAAYRQGYNDLATRMNALKTARPFYQFKIGQGEKGRKCSIDGERNVVIYRKTEAQNKAGETEASIQNKLLFASDNRVIEYTGGTGVHLRFLQPGEGLSAVSLAKRGYMFNRGDFESTANIALMDTLLQSMQTDGDRKPFDEYAQLFDTKDTALTMNGQLYYEDSLNKEYFRKQGIDATKLDKAKTQQKQLTEIIKQHGRSWDKYYALVVFDGDNMGELWRGESVIETEELKEFHTDLAKHLAAFAAHVREEFKKQHYGKVVYAGGDDFMGLVNLHHLFPVLQMLYDQYQKLVYQPLDGYLKPGRLLTFSAGICIAHYKEPLSLVLGKARELEKEAKHWQEGRKNCLALGVIPGSGQVAKTILPFEQLPTLQSIFQALQGNFSSTFVSKLRMEGVSLLGRNGQSPAHAMLAKEVLPALMNRYVERACNQQGDAKKASIQSLQENLHQLYCLMKFHTLLDTLDIADFIERQTRISEPAQPIPA